MSSTSQARKGSAEIVVLALLEERARHGYELARLIEEGSDGALQIHVASLYPLLYRLEHRGWIEGRWVERAGQRRRRYYRLLPAGRKVLDAERRAWRAFFEGFQRLVGFGDA